MQGDESTAGRSGDDAAPGDHQGAAERDQTRADADQTMADRDQTAADADQAASERDQDAADRDQGYADIEHAARAPGTSDNVYALARRGRSESTLARDLAAEARSDAARARDANAAQRDAVADWRDSAAAMRDQMAALRDADAENTDVKPSNGRALGMDLLLNAARDSERIAANRARAAAQREAAARDRAAAAEDRQQAALDRAEAAAEIAGQGVDHLTGTLRRQVGLAAMQREMDRAARAAEVLVLAFIDVDGLKTVNDTQGHSAGDNLLRAVAGCVREQMRSYDLIARYGGDEFVCTITGHELAGVRARFDIVADELAGAVPGAKITVGFAERQPDEALDHLINRADRILRGIRLAR